MIQVFKNVENTVLSQNFRINVQFYEDHFFLIVLDVISAWQTKISRSDLTEFADQFGISDKEYFSKLKLYLLETPENVEFRFMKTEFACYCQAESGINLKYFSAKLKKTDLNKQLFGLLESYSSQNQDFNRQNNHLVEVNGQLKEAKLKLEIKLTDLVDRKINDEQQLYSNFVLVLNEKKRRIQHLNQLLQAFKSGRPTLNQPPKVKVKAKREVKRETNQVSESDSESGNEGYNTDEEKSVNEIKKSKDESRNFDPVFDELDAAVTYDLPKRKKVGNGYKEDIDTPSTSKVQPSSSKEEVQMGVAENSPQIESTQDLLDCI